MDPLSNAASIIAVIQLSSEVVGFIGTATGAIKERKCLRGEVQACYNILQQLKDEADDSEEGKAWAKTIRALEEPDAPLGRLWAALTIIKAKLEPKSGLKKTLMSLKWPFQEKEVERIIAAIEREKNLLALALTNDFRKLIQDIRKSAKENGKQIIELINTTKDNQGQFSRLRDDLVRIQGSQANLKDVIDRLNRRHDHQEVTAEQRAVLDWLTPIDYAPQQNDFINRRQSGTGQWLLNSKKFTAWVENDKQTLFCPGIPGAGKTILTSIVIEYLNDKFRKGNTEDRNNEEDSEIGIAYLYCSFQRRDEQKLDDLLASLLKQLSQAMPSLPKVVTDLYEQHKKRRTRPSFDEISRTLQAVAAMCSRAFIIIDALDECQASDGCRTRVLTEVFRVQATSGASIFVTTRFVPEIIRQFEGSPSLEIRATEEDVRKYLDGHIFKLPGFINGDQSLQEEIKSGIIRLVRGMFLLAQLHLDSLVGKRSPKAIRTALAKLPLSSEVKAYDFAYQSAMERIEGQLAEQEQLAKQVMSWITNAKRPLTTWELQHALGVEVGEPELDDENLPQIEDMVSVCAGLVTIDEESGIIRLVHYTTQEYLERTQEHWFPDGKADITAICATYLSFSTFGSGFCESDEVFEERLRSNPLYDYAARNWGSHARETGTLSHSVIEFLTDSAKVEASSQALMASRVAWEKYSRIAPKQMTGLHLAAYFGIQKAVKALLSQWEDLDLEDNSGSTPLSWTPRNGHKAIIRQPLDKGADIEAKDSYGQTPLLWAAKTGHDTIVHLLLDKGANIEAKDRSGRTPLSWAVRNGYKAIVQLLLDKGADIKVKTSYGLTLLLLAAESGHEAIVQLLLDKGADIEEKTSHGLMPLLCAARDGHEAVVQLLLARGANIETKDKYGWTPLLWAAKGGHEAVVQLLLDKGANIEARDSRGQMPVLLATMNGHKAIVQLLLDKGANIEAKDRSGWTLLLLATGNGHKAIVELLLDKGANIEAKDRAGRMPLLCAAWKGYEVVVQLLLERGAEIEAKDRYGATPLLFAAENGYEVVVRLLLDRGAEIEAKDRISWTALLWAAKNGHEAVIQLLLDKGANIEAKDRYGWTPLLWAVKGGHEDAVQLLLNEGADIEAKNSHGQMALLLATTNGYEAIVQLLLDKGVNLEAKDRSGATPLSCASGNGQKAAVELLLDKGANIETKGRPSPTPLSSAAENGHEAVMQLLVDTGTDPRSL